MLKTNSKKARENIRKYILEGFNSEYANNPEIIVSLENFNAVAVEIMNCFSNEVLKHNKQYTSGKISEFQMFEYWCSGLCGIIDTCYYYNRSAVTDLGNILEQTIAERSKYSEMDSEKMLTRLIYRELWEAVL